MNLFDVLALIGGLCLFLFGMNIMGESLERSAGTGLNRLLGRLTTSKTKGFLTGLGVTAVIQSSSATTVMMVGFVNSGVMTLKQAINVIMGANVGTTVTSWLLSLTGIESSNVFVKLLKPTSFTPILALVGIVLYMMSKKSKHKDIGVILLGFSTLIFGMDAMSDAVSGLADVPEFQNILIMFQNPILGVLAGALLTGIIQSSSASVGILQALAGATGKVTIGASIPIIMGQNIGTCVTALISSVGTNRNARRASIVHLLFNVLGTTTLLSIYCVVTAIVRIDIINESANEMTIAICHTVFNLLCTAIMLPASGLLEKISYKLIKEPKSTPENDSISLLDQRLMAAPAVAIKRCKEVSVNMASLSAQSYHSSINLLNDYSEKEAEKLGEIEEKVDKYEDILGSYLVKLSTVDMNEHDSNEVSKLLFVIGDFERISDHAVNILRSAKEINEKSLLFTEAAKKELATITDAVSEILELTINAFTESSVDYATKVEPLEQVVDNLKRQLRANHIARMQRGECSIECGFVWSDLLTNLERISDHCSNIAVRIIETAHDRMDTHRYLQSIKATSDTFNSLYASYTEKYTV
ncbi:MAG: Na/Pi cotransporter family protein [Ruminococcaceae bacterium]|nr:Na/Pi cotransporter family protein [Oscillospiraceae bacterium]